MQLPIAAPHPLAPRPQRWRRFGLRGLQVLALGVVVATCLTLVLRQSFGSTLVY